MKKRTQIELTRDELMVLLKMYVDADIPDSAEIKIDTHEYYKATVDEHNPLEITWDNENCSVCGHDRIYHADTAVNHPFSA